MESLGSLSHFHVTPYVLWFVVLFHGGSIRDNLPVSDAAATTTFWSAWGKWSACNAVDGGRRSRSRNCVDPRGISQVASNCIGPARRTRQCETCAYSVMKPNSRSASSFVVSSPSFRRTGSKTAWCSSQRITSGKEYLEIAFKNAVRFTAVATRGHEDKSARQSGFVTTYKLLYSYDGAHWFPYTNQGLEVVFKGNVDATRLRRNQLDSGFVARFVRVYPTNYNSKPCIDVQLYGCEYNCGGLVTEEPMHVSGPNAEQLIEEPNCLWRIESKAATRFQLTFPYFKLRCRNGFLSVHNGASPFLEAELLEEFCGESEKISPLAVSKHNIWLHYRTNATTDDIGFRLRVNTIVTETLNSSTGEVTVPKTGGGYSHVFRYNWLITSSPNGTIELTIHNFNSDNIRRVNGMCVHDMLVIHDRNKPQNPLVGKYCDDDFPKVVEVTGGNLRIKFRAWSENPNWKLNFSFKIQDPPTLFTFSKDPAGSATVEYTEVLPTRYTANDTLSVLNTTGIKRSTETGASMTPVIVASILAAVIAVVFLVALLHYLRKRKAFSRKHPYDCSSTRPMSHFGDEDSTPFINTNVLMWSDSNSRNYDKEKPRNGKNSLPFVTVALREDAPQRLSFISPEMISGNSQLSLEESNQGKLSESFVVSDAFTEECLELLNNNLSSAFQERTESAGNLDDEQRHTDSQHEGSGLDPNEPFLESEMTSPEDNESSPEVNDLSDEGLLETGEDLSETGEHLPEVSEG